MLDFLSRHIFVSWHEPVIFCHNLFKGWPVNHVKFQHDGPSGSADISKKKHGSFTNPCPVEALLSLASRGLTSMVWLGWAEINSLSHHELWYFFSSVNWRLPAYSRFCYVKLHHATLARPRSHYSSRQFRSRCITVVARWHGNRSGSSVRTGTSQKPSVDM